MGTYYETIKRGASSISRVKKRKEGEKGGRGIPVRDIVRDLDEILRFL